MSTERCSHIHANGTQCTFLAPVPDFHGKCVDHASPGDREAANRNRIARAHRNHLDRLGFRLPENCASEQTTIADELLDRDALDDLPSPEPIIDGVLMAHTYTVLSGRHATNKTFVALDWSGCVATGKDWLGRNVAQPGRVLYVAGEGAYGLPARVNAWETAWGMRIPSDRFSVLPRAVNLLRGGPDFDDLLRVVQDGGYRLVVVDTLRRASSGADENSTRDMGQVVERIDLLKRATDAGAVLVVAHTDKGDNSTRGASAIEDDADILWRAEADDYRILLRNPKMKDAAETPDIHLRARPFAESIVLEAFTEPAVRGVGEMSPSESRVLSILATTFPQTGATAAQLETVAKDAGIGRSTLYGAINGLLKREAIEGDKPRQRGCRYFAKSSHVQHTREAV